MRKQKIGRWFEIFIVYEKDLRILIAIHFLINLFAIFFMNKQIFNPNENALSVYYIEFYNILIFY